MPLIFFVDSLISESTLPFAAEWNRKRLAYERNELAGDEKFFDFLDETLAEKGPDADERLVRVLHIFELQDQAPHCYPVLGANDGGHRGA